MEVSEYYQTFKLEKTHFYYLANHQIIIDLIRKYLGKRQKIKILDAGCGTGLLAKKMEKFGTVLGVDVSFEALKYAKRRGILVKQASVTALPLKDSSFDLITCVNVIYHQEVSDDQKALDEFYRILKPGGFLIIRVPAYNWLKRSSDLQVHTKVRYSLTLLKRKLLKSGFKLRKISYIDLLLLPPSLISLFWEKIFPPKTPKSPLVKLPSILNTLMAKLLSWESSILLKINLPFGLGILAVCQRGRRWRGF